jgi:hypothetical protein
MQKKLCINCGICKRYRDKRWCENCIRASGGFKEVKSWRSPKRGVYLISDNFGHVKIGVFSGNVSNRLSGLQTGNPKILFVKDHLFHKDPYGLEKVLHSRYRHLHVRGEWFKDEPEIVLWPFTDLSSIESSERHIFESPCPSTKPLTF